MSWFKRLFCNKQKIEMDKIHRRIDNIMKTQKTDGNWNYDAYMHGMLNGMIIVESIVKDIDPKFRNAPDKWIADENEIEL